MKRRNKILTLIIISAIIGLLFSFLIHNGYMYKLTSGLKIIKWYLYPLIILFVFFLVILIHELGHLFSFLLNGIKIRAIFVLIFVLMKDPKGKWKFKVDFSNIKLIGGIVVPNLDNITDEKLLNKNRRSFEKALIAGPNISIFYFVVSFLSFIIFWFLTSYNLLIALLFINFIITTLMTTLIILSSRLNTNELYGDYVARRLFKENDTFALLQLIQYLGFSLKDTEKSYEFLFNYLTNFYQLKKLSYNFFDLILTTNYLNLYLSNDNFKNNESIDKVIKFYNINRLSRSKHGLELAYLISSTYYKNNNLVKAFEVFNLISINRNNYVDKKQQEFLKKQYAHYINLEDNNEYFINNIDFINDELFILKPLFDIDEIIKDFNKTLEFKKYYTKLYCKI